MHTDLCGLLDDGCVQGVEYGSLRFELALLDRLGDGGGEDAAGHGQGADEDGGLHVGG